MKIKDKEKIKVIKKSQIKYAYFDLDGTLSNLFGKISDKTIKAIKILHQNNVKVGIATGRFLTMFKDVNQDLKMNLPTISASVSDVGYDITFDNDKIIQGGVNKGLALEKLASEKVIDLNHTIVFGDSYNDIEMFQVSKYSIAMGNAVDELKNIATITIKPAREEGIFHFINNLFNK